MAQALRIELRDAVLDVTRRGMERRGFGRVEAGFQTVEATIVDDAEDLMEDEEFRQEVEEFVRGRYYQTEEIILETYERTLAGYACCEETTNEGYCQFVPAEQCKEGTLQLPTLCEDASFCEFGCCISEKTGWCNENTPKIRCEIEGGIWKNDKFCNVQECQRGCCVIGNNAIFTTQRNCQVEAGFLGIEPDFRTEIKTEIAKPKKIPQQNKQLHTNCAQDPFWQTTCNKKRESNNSFLLRAPAAYLSGWFFLALIT